MSREIFRGTLGLKVIRKKSPDQVGEILGDCLRRLDLSQRLSQYGVFSIWNETVGPTIRRNAQPERIRHGTLFVRVASAAWMQELQYMKEMVRAKLNESLGKEAVKNIFFFVGRVEAPQEREEAPASPTPPEIRQGLGPSTPIASSTGAAGTEEYLKTVNDPEIRAALRSLFDSARRRMK